MQACSYDGHIQRAANRRRSSTRPIAEGGLRLSDVGACHGAAMFDFAAQAEWGAPPFHMRCV